MVSLMIILIHLQMGWFYVSKLRRNLHCLSRQLIQNFPLYLDNLMREHGYQWSLTLLCFRFDCTIVLNLYQIRSKTSASHRGTDKICLSIQINKTISDQSFSFPFHTTTVYQMKYIRAILALSVSRTAWRMVHSGQAKQTTVKIEPNLLDAQQLAKCCMSFTAVGVERQVVSQGSLQQQQRQQWHKQRYSSHQTSGREGWFIE